MKQVKSLVLQQKTTTLYCFTMDARELEALCYVQAMARDNKKGFQRVTEEARLRDVGDWVKQSNNLLPNNIIVNLNSSVKVEANSDGTATITFPEDAGEYAFVVDGQHRLFSFRDDFRKLPDSEKFDLPVIALHDASENTVGQTFISINTFQKPVNRNLLTEMQMILGLMGTDTEKATVELIHELDEDKSSPLRDKILRLPKEKNKWITTNQLRPVVKGLVSSGGCLNGKTGSERRSIIVSYLEAVEATFPDAWADTKRASYSLLSPTALQIMIALLPDVMNRCDFYEGFTYNKKTFEAQLEPLKNLTILGGWSKSSVEESISVKPRREALLGELRGALKVTAPSTSP